MLSIFSSAYWPSICLLWRNVYLGLLPIFGLGFWFLLLSCMSYLCILEITPMSVTSFANIFFQSGVFFHFVSFAVRELLSLSRSHKKAFFYFSDLIWAWRCNRLKITILPLFSEESYKCPN